MKVTLNRQLIGLEDIVFGVGTVEQTRGGEVVEITKINVANLPFDEVNTFKEVLDATYPLIIPVVEKLPEIERVFESIGNVDAVGEELVATNNIETIAADLSLGVNSDIRKVNALEPKMDYTKDTLEPKMDYTKDTLEPKLNYTKDTLEPKMDYTKDTLEPKMAYTKDTLEPKMDYTKDTLEPKMDVVIANEVDIQNAADNAILAKNYANANLGVEVETSLYSAKHWAITAADIVTDGVIDDVAPSTLRTFSSSKMLSITDSKTPYVIINEDNAVKLISIKTKKSWTKGFSGTGALQIELQNLYGFSLDGMMQVRIKETTGNSIIINIDGRWDASSTWSSYNATSDTAINVRFAKDTSKAYILIGDTSTVWGNTRIEIDNVLSNYNAGLNLDFVMSVVSSYPTTVVATVNAMNKVDKVASTDNAIVRFDGTTGQVQNSGVVIDDYNGITANAVNIVTASTFSNFSSYGLKIKDSSTTSKQLAIGYSADTNTGVIQSVNEGVAYNDLVLQPLGGNVGIGVTPSTEGRLAILPVASANCIVFDCVPGYNTSTVWKNGGVSKFTDQLMSNGNLRRYNYQTNIEVMTNTANGNLLVGATTDNGVDKLQVNGSISRLSKSFSNFNTAFTLATGAIYEGVSVYSPTSQPSNGEAWWFVKSLCTYPGGSCYIAQIATSLSGRIFTRYSSNNGGSWSAWVEK